MTFTDSIAVRESVPLLLGLTGCSGSGKTYSMLELLTGMQQVVDSEIWIIDTEHKRALFYADMFKFRHVPFDAPFSPVRYLEAIEYCVSKGGRLIGVDSMTHEHNGVGGVMDQAEQYLDKKCGDDEACRQKNFMLSLVKPKAQRKKLNTRIIQMGINGVFCYRATEKVKPVPGKEPVKMGWQTEGTSPLFYDMAQMFLLPPGADGKPQFKPETNAEKMLVKTPAQFRDWFKEGQQLNRAMGQKMAQWASGTPSSPDKSPGVVGAATLSSGEAPTKRERFVAAMEALKARDAETYIRALGVAGYEKPEDIPAAKCQEIFDQVKQAIDERAAISKQ